MDSPLLTRHDAWLLLGVVAVYALTLVLEWWWNRKRQGEK